MKDKRYDPAKCQRRIVARVIGPNGGIALMAHHAFSWGVAIEKDGKISMIQLPREEARKEYNRRKKCF